MDKPLKDHLNELSNDNLRKIVADCYDIIEKRKKVEKAKLVEAFKEAFYNLENAGIEVSVECVCCGEYTTLAFSDLYID